MAELEVNSEARQKTCENGHACDSLFFSNLDRDRLVKLGERVAKCLRPGDVVLLSGPLGAGKTTFTKGIVCGLGGDEKLVTSPTFTLMNVYACSVTVYHIDAFRLGGVEEAFYVLEGELEDGDGVFVVEWGESILDLFGAEILSVRIDYADENHRNVTLRWNPNGREDLRRCLEVATEEVGEIPIRIDGAKGYEED